MSALIGALRATLGLDSAAFEKGATAIEKRSQNLERKIQSYGKGMTDLGQKLSLAVSVPLAALSASVLGLADDAKQLRNAANLAGEGFEDFQRHAYAAKSVGIEFDKLSDILKDTQDKIGDFIANGGGEMADFFENIAPKVGVTAEQFKKLSSKDALQLYYDSLVKAGVSQKELVFYMEAIADEGSGLIPILQDNGKAMKELGANAAIISEKDAEGLRKFTAAQLELSNAFQKLKIAIANSGLIEFATIAVEKLAGLVDKFDDLPPGVQRAVVVIGAIAAAAGPVLIVLGQLATGLSSFLAIVGTAGAAGGPVVAAEAGIAGLGGAAGVAAAAGGPLLALAAAGIVIYKNWDEIEPLLVQVKDSVEALGKGFSDLNSKPQGPESEAIKSWRELGSTLRQVVEVVISAWDVLDRKADQSAKFQHEYAAKIAADWRYLTTEVPKQIGAMVDAVRSWMVDKLGAVWDGVERRIEKVKGYFFGLYDAVVGHSYIPDMVDGIAAQMDRLDAAMVDKAKVASKNTADAFKALAAEVQPLLDRLFPEVAQMRQLRQEAALIDRAVKGGALTGEQGNLAKYRLATEGGGNPFEALKEVVTEAFGAMGKGVLDFAAKVGEAGATAAEEAARMKESFEEMADRSLAAFDRLAQSIKHGGFLDILGSVIGMGMQLGRVGVFGSKVSANIKASDRIPPYANGTSFHPGGLALVGERGPEIVGLPRGSKVWPNGTGPGGGTTVNHFSGNLMTPEFWERIQRGDVAAADAGGRIGQARVRQSQSWRLG